MGSYYAMGFVKTEYGITVRSLRVKGFKSMKAAQNKILKANVEGYIKKLGVKQPVWENVVR